MEKRLKQEVQALNPDLSLPPEIAAHIRGGTGGSTAYGQSQKRDAQLTKVSSNWLMLLVLVASLVAHCILPKQLSGDAQSLCWNQSVTFTVKPRLRVCIPRAE